jgi:hypothetical protein
MAAALLRPTPAELGHAVVSNDSERDGASVRPCKSIDFVLDYACACVTPAVADGFVAISVDLRFLANPRCSPPSLVVCVALHCLAAVWRRRGWLCHRAAIAAASFFTR